ncbi:MAG: exodeoxyribonuclease VII large subunit, partial [Myxococcota bacterium]
EGEVRGLRVQPSSGHAYFDLADRRARVPVFMSAMYVRRLPFPLEEGLHVLLGGEVSLFEPRGRLQLVAKRLEPLGEGALLLAFRAKVSELEREGLTDPKRRRRLPPHPKKIGVVTSRSGAALRDVLRTALRRDPRAHLVLGPTPVQGIGAVEGVVRALRALDRHGCDVLLLVRGGGSLEDLHAFNETAVARAVSACRTPVVTGVGHETDTTLVDLVADARASTPTAAAEHAVPVREETEQRWARLKVRMVRALRGRLVRGERDLGALRARLSDPTRQVHRRAQRLDALAREAEAALEQRLAASRQRLQGLTQRLERARPEAGLERQRRGLERLEARLHGALRASVEEARQRSAGLATRLPSATRRHLDRGQSRLRGSAAALHALSPLAVLGRGYAVVTKEDRVVRSSTEVRPGDSLRVRVGKGSFGVSVEDVSE